jgi:hypothetical protein
MILALLKEVVVFHVSISSLNLNAYLFIFYELQ